MCLPNKIDGSKSDRLRQPPGELTAGEFRADGLAAGSVKRPGGSDKATALVTGTSSGIGLATALALARVGHTVAATMRNLDRGEEIRTIAEREKLPIHLAAMNTFGFALSP